MNDKIPAAKATAKVENKKEHAEFSNPYTIKGVCKIYRWDNPEKYKVYELENINIQHPAVGFDSASVSIDLASIENITPYELTLINTAHLYKIEVYLEGFLNEPEFLLFKGVILNATGNIAQGRKTLEISAISDFYLLDKLNVYVANPANPKDIISTPVFSVREGVPDIYLNVGGIYTYYYWLMNRAFCGNDKPSLSEAGYNILDLHNHAKEVNEFSKLIENVLNTNAFRYRIITSVLKDNDYNSDCKYIKTKDKKYLLDFLIKDIYEAYARNTFFNFIQNAALLLQSGMETSLFNLLSSFYNAGFLVPNIQYVRTGKVKDSYLIFKPAFMLFRPVSQNFIPMKSVYSFSYSVDISNKPTRTTVEVPNPIVSTAGEVGTALNMILYSATAPITEIENKAKVIYNNKEYDLPNIIENIPGQNSQKKQTCIFCDEKEKSKKLDSESIHKSYRDIVTKEEESLGFINHNSITDPALLHFLNFNSKKVDKTTIYKMIKLIAEYKHEEARILSVNGGVIMPLNPFIKPGFPCILIDKDNPERDLYGYVTNVSHSITQGSAVTSVSIAGLRPAYIKKDSKSKDGTFEFDLVYEDRITPLFNQMAKEGEEIIETVAVDPIWVLINKEALVNTKEQNLTTEYKTCANLLTSYYVSLGLWWFYNKGEFTVTYKDKNGRTVKKTNPTVYELLMSDQMKPVYRDPKNYIGFLEFVKKYEEEFNNKIYKTILDMDKSIKISENNYKIENNKLIFTCPETNKKIELDLGKQNSGIPTHQTSVFGGDKK